MALLNHVEVGITSSTSAAVSCNNLNGVRQLKLVAMIQPPPSSMDRRDGVYVCALLTDRAPTKVASTKTRFRRHYLLDRRNTKDDTPVEELLLEESCFWSSIIIYLYCPREEACSDRRVL